MSKSVERRITAQGACKHIDFTILMGCPLFGCELNRKNYPKCEGCPKYEPRNKRIL